jgi:hypothetical protein
VNGKSVKTNWTTLGYSDGLALTIDSSEPAGNHRLDKLVGVEKIEGSVVGDYTLIYECQALVVDTPTLIIDQTKK